MNALTGECNNFGTSAAGCGLGCAAGFGLGKLFKWGKKAWNKLPCGINSFTPDTLVHVRPKGAENQDATFARAALKPISQIEVGEEVLAFSEWKDGGDQATADRRLSYEKVTDVFTSYRQQILVHLTLDSGETLTATEGHPFMTTDGWRDAVLLKKGGKLLLKNSDDGPGVARFATIADVRNEVRTVTVFNLEVANAHTFFAGEEGTLVHNARHHLCTNKHSYWSDKFRTLFRKAGLGKGRKDPLNDPRNLRDIPGHKGPHPDEMHADIYNRLKNAYDRAGPEAMKQMLDRIGKQATTPGTRINNQITRK
jgi:hypothetical protein